MLNCAKWDFITRKDTFWVPRYFLWDSFSNSVRHKGIQRVFEFLFAKKYKSSSILKSFQFFRKRLKKSFLSPQTHFSCSEIPFSRFSILWVRDFRRPIRLLLREIPRPSSYRTQIDLQKPSGRVTRAIDSLHYWHKSSRQTGGSTAAESNGILAESSRNHLFPCVV